MSGPFTVVAIGCSGPVAQQFVDRFIDEGAALQILARRPDEMRQRYPRAEIVQGSMMDRLMLREVPRGPTRSSSLHRWGSTMIHRARLKPRG